MITVSYCTVTIVIRSTDLTYSYFQSFVLFYCTSAPEFEAEKFTCVFRDEIWKEIKLLNERYFYQYIYFI